MDPRKTLLAAAALALMVAPSFTPVADAATTYTQPVWFNWSKKTLDILVLDIHDPFIGTAITRAMDVWKNGISYWNPTLGSQLVFRTYWADSTTNLPSGYRPDIVWVPQGFMAVHTGGNGNEAQPTCYVTAPMLVAYGSFIRVTTHEFGHCLGLDHVFADGAEYKPSQDIMGDGDGWKCPSNINVEGITRAFSGSRATVTTTPAAYLQAPSC